MIKRAEVLVFFTEHNIAFSTIDHLIPLIRDMYQFLLIF